MKFFLFKFFLKLAGKFAPRKEIASYLTSKVNCLVTQGEMDDCIRPRTETYEHLTCEKQRDLFTKLMPPRTLDRTPRRLYSDYEERKAFGGNPDKPPPKKDQGGLY
jgi:hypothetical protein|tara:strand:+ start:2414 stop:2731 length:318 start_codon:yes stop_codon:yes gene_type:complete